MSPTTKAFRATTYLPQRSSRLISQRPFSSSRALREAPKDAPGLINHPPTKTRNEAAPKPSPKPRSPLPVWPILAILAGGTGLFYSIVKQREGQAQPPPRNASSRPGA